MPDGESENYFVYSDKADKAVSLKSYAVLIKQELHRIIRTEEDRRVNVGN